MKKWYKYWRSPQKKTTISLSLLLAHSLIIVSYAFFLHTHVLNDGTQIVHAHPFVQSQPEVVEEEVPSRPVADQETMVGGGFAQIERQLGLFSLSGGLRLDHYNVTDNVTGNELSNNVLSPRVTMLYGITSPFQVRMSYAQGYRAPQIFDEDLHIETSDSRQVIHKNAPGLKQETSHSYTGSLSYIIENGSTNLELLSEFFLTNLNNPFANEIGTPDAQGRVIYTRVNESEGATVKGVNLEAKWAASQTLSFNSGFTIQNSEYGTPQDFDVTNAILIPEKTATPVISTGRLIRAPFMRD